MYWNFDKNFNWIKGKTKLVQNPFKVFLHHLLQNKGDFFIIKMVQWYNWLFQYTNIYINRFGEYKTFFHKWVKLKFSIFPVLSKNVKFGRLLQSSFISVLSTKSRFMRFLLCPVFFCWKQCSSVCKNVFQISFFYFCVLI